MNTQEAMQALIDGKRITATYLKRAGDFIWLSAGELIDREGDIRGLPPDGEWTIYEEPNLFTYGTFNWARLEAQRGNRMTRPGLGYCVLALFFRVPGNKLTLADIDATDWMVEP